MQRCWEKGEIPESWKEADMALIPIPDEEIRINNLRPISLTSCIGKLMEKVVQTRLDREKGWYPNSMIGFRRSLSANDKEQVLERKTQDARVILGLDVSKAFDWVSHLAVLDNLNGVSVGAKTFHYVKGFLSNRKVKIRNVDQESDSIECGEKGTSQGAVLSPSPVNVAPLGLPRWLEGIDGLGHALYADDLTIWPTKGSSDGEITEKL